MKRKCLPRDLIIDSMIMYQLHVLYKAANDIWSQYTSTGITSVSSSSIFNILDFKRDNKVHFCYTEECALFTEEKSS